jgi:hypothetical protein
VLIVSIRDAQGIDVVENILVYRCKKPLEDHSHANGHRAAQHAASTEPSLAATAEPAAVNPDSAATVITAGHHRRRQLLQQADSPPEWNNTWLVRALFGAPSLGTCCVVLSTLFITGCQSAVDSIAVTVCQPQSMALAVCRKVSSKGSHCLGRTGPRGGGGGERGGRIREGGHKGAGKMGGWHRCQPKPAATKPVYHDMQIDSCRLCCTVVVSYCHLQQPLCAWQTSGMTGIQCHDGHRPQAGALAQVH